MDMQTYVYVPSQPRNAVKNFLETDDSDDDDIPHLWGCQLSEPIIPSDHNRDPPTTQPPAEPSHSDPSSTATPSVNSTSVFPPVTQPLAEPSSTTVLSTALASTVPTEREGHTPCRSQSPSAPCRSPLAPVPCFRPLCRQLSPAPVPPSPSAVPLHCGDRARMSHPSSILFVPSTHTVDSTTPPTPLHSSIPFHPSAAVSLASTTPILNRNHDKVQLVE